MLRRAVVAAVLLVTVTQLGCAKRVRLGVTPRNAKVTVDGRRLPTDAPEFQDISGTGKSYVVRVEAPGYEPLQTTLRQETNAMCMVGWGLCGCFTLIGFAGMLFCNSLPKDSYYFELDRAGQGAELQRDETRPESNEVLPTDPPL